MSYVLRKAVYVFFAGSYTWADAFAKSKLALLPTVSGGILTGTTGAGWAPGTTGSTAPAHARIRGSRSELQQAATGHLSCETAAGTRGAAGLLDELRFVAETEPEPVMLSCCQTPKVVVGFGFPSSCAGAHTILGRPGLSWAGQQPDITGKPLPSCIQATCMQCV